MTGFLCALPLVASLFSSCANDGGLAAGYVEGEFVLLAPIATAQIESIGVKRGDRVTVGQELVILQRADAENAVNEARAAVAQSEAQLADLKLGRRPEELAVLEAAVNQTKAQVEEAKRVYSRQTDLLQRRISAQANFDQAETSLQLAEASLQQQQANLAVARLPARADAIVAAEAAVTQAHAALDQAQWQLTQRVIKATSPGRITDVIRNPGELAGPSAAVLSMLPDNALKLKFYVPEAALSSLTTGAVIDVSCDGCPQGLRAAISYISPDPEFTPPVIYSPDNRQKLVFLVEARPEKDMPALNPGQIVDVRLAGETP